MSAKYEEGALDNAEAIADIPVEYEARITALGATGWAADARERHLNLNGEELNARRGSESADRSRLQNERTQVARKLDRLYDVIAEGLRTLGLKERLEEMEGRVAELDAILSEPPPSPVRLHPNLADTYRRKVTELSTDLEDPEIRTPALEAIRYLIEQVTVFQDPFFPAFLNMVRVLPQIHRLFSCRNQPAPTKPPGQENNTGQHGYTERLRQAVRR